MDVRVIGAGVVVALASGWVLRSFLLDVRPFDPLTINIASIVVAAP